MATMDEELIEEAEELEVALSEDGIAQVKAEIAEEAEDEDEEDMH